MINENFTNCHRAWKSLDNTQGSKLTAPLPLPVPPPSPFPSKKGGKQKKKKKRTIHIKFTAHVVFCREANPI